MGFIVGILTALLVLNCLVLILLVLIQLPKKDAGAGMAFGGGAADALFGAGSGNALTKITKYATVIFFVMALILGFLQDQVHKQSGSSLFEKQVQEKQMQTPAAPPTSPLPNASQAMPTNGNLLPLPLTSPNTPAASSSNPAAAPPK